MEEDLFVKAQSDKFFAECLWLAGNKKWSADKKAAAMALWAFAKSLYPDFPAFLPFQFREFLEKMLRDYFRRNIQKATDIHEMVEEDGFLFAEVLTYYTPYGIVIAE